MAYGGRTGDPVPPAPSTIDLSRVAMPKRLESRRDARGTDVKTFSLLWTLDGGGSSFVPDTIGADYRIRVPATISSISFWEATGALASIDFDLWRGDFGSALTIADSILPAPISVVGAASYEDEILANVDTQLIIGQVLKLYINSAANISRGYVELQLERSI